MTKYLVWASFALTVWYVFFRKDMTAVKQEFRDFETNFGSGIGP